MRSKTSLFQGDSQQLLFMEVLSNNRVLFKYIAYLELINRSLFYGVQSNFQITTCNRNIKK